MLGKRKDHGSNNVESVIQEIVSLLDISKGIMQDLAQRLAQTEHVLLHVTSVLVENTMITKEQARELYTWGSEKSEETKNETRHD